MSFEKTSTNLISDLLGWGQINFTITLRVIEPRLDVLALRL